ncbi:MAG: homoserine dehydrogenase [Pseudomonadota bacterium]
MSEPFRIAIAGLGTVGRGVVKILQNQSDLIANRVGRPIEIVAVNARDKSADRGVDLSTYDWVDNPSDLSSRDDVDCVLEMIGGSEGVAKDLVEAALDNGKHVITANKALLAHHGLELAEKAENKNVSLNYEAAVAGGIPIIKSMREGLAADKVTGVYGILNGTCNYILTEMRETGRDFADVLKDAQELGYAEADPSFDVGGIDAAHKLALLTALGFGVKPDFDQLSIEGIESITADDIQFADELGYRIKLIGMARDLNGKIYQTMAPCLVPTNSALGSVEGVFNAVFVEADPVDKAMAEGRGAGEGPTASAVVADVIDLARGIHLPTFGVKVQDLQGAQWASLSDVSAQHYLRLNVLDQPGVIADVSAVLRDHEISIESLVQRGHDPQQPVSVVMVTHETNAQAMQDAIADISKIPAILDQPSVLRIEHI